MTKSISGNELLEYGSFQGNMFGTKIETIQKIHEQGKIALLDVEPQVSQLYRSRLLEPFWKHLKWWDWPKVRKICLQGWMILRAYWAGNLQVLTAVQTHDSSSSHESAWERRLHQTSTDLSFLFHFFEPDLESLADCRLRPSRGVHRSHQHSCSGTQNFISYTLRYFEAPVTRQPIGR